MYHGPAGTAVQVSFPRFRFNYTGLRASDLIRRPQVSGFGFWTRFVGLGLGLRLGLRALDSIAAGFRLWASDSIACGLPCSIVPVRSRIPASDSITRAIAFSHVISANCMRAFRLLG